MKCVSCPLVENKETYIIEEVEVNLYECPFGDHAFHLGDHRCTKLGIRKDTIAALKLQNEGGKANDTIEGMD